MQRHSGLAVGGSLALLVVLAVPFLGVHFAIPDAGNDSEGSSNRQAYDMMAEGFGPGTSGPLLVAVDLARADDDAALERLHASLEVHRRSRRGVAAAGQS